MLKPHNFYIASVAIADYHLSAGRSSALPGKINLSNQGKIVNMKLTRIRDFEVCFKIFNDQMTLVCNSIESIINTDADPLIKEYMLQKLIKDYRASVRLFRDKCTYNEKNYSETDYFLGLEPWEPLPEFDEFVKLHDLY